MRNMLPYREQQRSEHEPTRRRGRRAAGGALHDRRLPKLPGLRREGHQAPVQRHGREALLAPAQPQRHVRHGFAHLKRSWLGLLELGGTVARGLRKPRK